MDLLVNTDKSTGDLKSGHIQILNGQKGVGLNFEWVLSSSNPTIGKPTKMAAILYLPLEIGTI